ncbi:MAG TPA: PA2169 family four-helix-bundle protein [Gemmatimonas sp.]|nr:PA2169 family four-helix-bundle protein [Gemmatimonas sp.]
MTDLNKTAVSTLNELIETCKDGANGFRAAAEAVTHPDAKALFSSRVPIIERAAGELQAEVQRLGGSPETTGTVAAAVHRGWMGLKSAVSGKDEAAILTECERGEELAVTKYEEAMKADLPAESHAVVEAQYRGTISNLEKVRALGRAYGASKPTIAPTPATDRS